MADKPKPSIPPPAPAPWSRPRDDQPTTEMRAAAAAIADSVSTSEFTAASEPVTEKLDKDEVRAVRADGRGVIDRRNRVVPTPPDPTNPAAIPLDDVKTDVMADPPDFGAEFREGKRASKKPTAVKPRPLVPVRHRTGLLTKFVVGFAIAAVGLAVWAVFFFRR